MDVGRSFTDHASHRRHAAKPTFTPPTVRYLHTSSSQRFARLGLRRVALRPVSSNRAEPECGRCFLGAARLDPSRDRDVARRGDHLVKLVQQRVETGFEKRGASSAWIRGRLMPALSAPSMRAAPR
eukprot:4543984-Prymnesium_polylepis.1